MSAATSRCRDHCSPLEPFHSGIAVYRASVERENSGFKSVVIIRVKESHKGETNPFLHASET